MYESSLETNPRKQRLLEFTAGTLPPLIALFIELALYSVIQPHVWFLFYPAVLLSSWWGGLRSAILATTLSCMLVWVFFEVPYYGFAKSPLRLVPVIVFFTTNMAIVLIHHKLRKTAIGLQRSLEQHNRELKYVNHMMSRLFEQAPDGIFIADLEGRYVSVNRAACRMLGYSCNELVGMRITDLILPEEAPRLEREKARLLKGEVHIGEWALRRKDGTMLPVEVGSTILPDGRWQAYVRDITERKQAQEQIRQSQERFELALRGADLGAWDWNIKTGEVIFNPQWAEMRGYRLEEVRGHLDTWYTGVHPDDKLRVQKALHDHAKGLTPEYETEYRARTKSGDWIWILDHGKVLTHDEQGQPLRMLGIEINITERKRAEEELSFLAEVGPVMAASLDYEETLSRVAQLAVQELADFCIVDLVDDDDQLHRFKVTCRDSSRNWICEELMRLPMAQTPLLTKSAMERRESVLLERVYPEDIALQSQNEEHLKLLHAAEIHSVIAVPLLVRDRAMGAIIFISAQSSGSYWRAHLRIAEELTRRAALSIENARLYRAAGRAVQVRDDVLEIVAHDLRNPLGIILTQAGLLARGEVEPERRRSPVDAIFRSATRMNRLIQDLLDVSRIESGGLVIEPDRVAVEQVMTDVLETQKLLAESARLELRVDSAHDLPDVWADRSRLDQILENLIGNALKFSKPGGQIAVGAVSRDGEVVFRVKDSGTGIASDHLPHIFDRYWHAKSSDGGGAGLGLSIVKGLVEAHKGRIWAESVPGDGSTFYFTLPIVGAEQFASSAAST